MHRFLFAVEKVASATFSRRDCAALKRKRGKRPPPAPPVERAEGTRNIPSPIEQSPVPWYTTME